MFAHARPAFFAHGSTQAGIGEKTFDAYGEGIEIKGADKKTGFALDDDLRGSAGVEGQDREAVGHSFHQDVAEGFEDGGGSQELGPFELCSGFGFWDMSEELDGQAVAPGVGFKGGALVAIAQDAQPPWSGHAPENTQEQVQPFAADEVAQEDEGPLLSSGFGDRSLTFQDGTPDGVEEKPGTPDAVALEGAPHVMGMSFHGVDGVDFGEQALFPPGIIKDEPAGKGIAGEGAAKRPPTGRVPAAAQGEAVVTGSRVDHGVVVEHFGDRFSGGGAALEEGGDCLAGMVVEDDEIRGKTA